MSEVNLTKKAEVNLTKKSPNSSKYRVELSWDVPSSGKEYDLDASVFGLTNDGDEPKLVNSDNFINFNHLHNVNESIKHTGDNLTGEGEGADETIMVDTSGLDSKIDELSFVVTIYNAKNLNQNFGQVDNALIEVKDDNSGKVLASYKLNEDFNVEIGVHIGSLTKNDHNEWSFVATGEGYDATLDDFYNNYK